MAMTNDDKVPFTLRIKKPIDDRLTQASDELGISKTAFIMIALNEKLKDQPVPWAGE